MLNLEQAPLEVVSRRRDPRMTLPSRPGEVPADGLLGRRAFALVPWIVVSVAALAYACSEALRFAQDDLNWIMIGIALAVSAGSLTLAFLQDRQIGLRYRRALWVYVVFGLGITALLAAAAVADTGVASVVFAGAGPVAMYLGLVAPPAWRLRVLATFFVATTVVQVANPATALFDVVVVWSMIVASWACGVLVSIGYARTTNISRRLGGYDAATRSLSRRTFMEQLEFAMAHEEDADRPLALLLIGVDLARAGDQHSGDDGARVLQWIGTAVPALLPATAEFGRLGDGELGVLLSDISRHDAQQIAEEIERALSVRVPTTVGVATTQTRDLPAADLFRVADAARALAARDGRGVHALVAGTVESSMRIQTPVETPTLRYAEMRATGKVPRLVEEMDLNRRILTMSLLLVAAAGVPNIARSIFDPGEGFATDLVRYGGGLWLAWVLASAEVTRRWGGRGYPRIDALIVTSGALIMPIGVASAGLASGGLTASIVAAFFVKTLFDAAVHTRAIASGMCGCLLVAWGVMVALSPADTLWAAPFQLALFGGCIALGRIARAAMDETADHARSRASTDDLTQFSNRAGFIDFAEEAFYQSVTTTGQPFALITFRLDGLRAYNEAYGYAAGDAMLRTIADLLEDRIPAYYVIGRTGATMFSAAVAVGGANAASGLAHDLCVAIGELTSVRAGCATCPADGATLAALMDASEHSARPRRVATA